MRVSVRGVAEVAREIRTATKWSQVDLATKLRVHQVTVARWEQQHEDIQRMNREVFLTLRELAMQNGVKTQLELV